MRPASEGNWKGCSRSCCPVEHGPCPGDLEMGERVGNLACVRALDYLKVACVQHAEHERHAGRRCEGRSRWALKGFLGFIVTCAECVPNDLGQGSVPAKAVGCDQGVPFFP